MRLRSKRLHPNGCTLRIAELLYEETAPEQVKTLEGIEEAVRGYLLNYVNPEIAKILSTKAVEPTQAESEK